MYYKTHFVASVGIIAIPGTIFLIWGGLETNFHDLGALDTGRDGDFQSCFNAFH